MDYLNFIIIFLILKFSLIILSFIIITLISNLLKKPSSIQHYKLNNIWHTISITFDPGIDKEFIEFVKTQHFIVLLFGTKTFKYETLKEIAGNDIIITSYENQPCKILTLIEAYVAQKFDAFLKSNTNINFEYHLINSENLPSFFDVNKSLDRTQQQHCDNVLISKFMVQYCDIKSFIGLTVLRSRIALFQENTSICNKLLNELLTTITKVIKDKKFDNKHVITVFYNKIKNIHKGSPNRFNEILKELAQIFFDPEYKDLKISFAFGVGKDLIFDKFYEEFIKHKVESLAQSSDIDLTSFFPRDCTVNGDTRHHIKELMEKLFSVEIMQAYERIAWI